MPRSAGVSKTCKNMFAVATFMSLAYGTQNIEKNGKFPYIDGVDRSFLNNALLPKHSFLSKKQCQTMI